MTKLKFALVTFALLLIAGLVPFHRITAPHWYVSVLTSGGTPVPGVSVREEVNDYSCGGKEQEETKTTDPGGHVEFQAKYIRTSLLQCGAKTISSAGAGVHASFGRNVYVFAIGVEPGQIIDERGNIFTWTGSPAVLSSRILLNH